VTEGTAQEETRLKAKRVMSDTIRGEDKQCKDIQGEEVQDLLEGDGADMQALPAEAGHVFDIDQGQEADGMCFVRISL
jgi:hypothetical protein